jgi:FKBP-type peptidyl-prolyl cis-trans isomerase
MKQLNLLNNLILVLAIPLAFACGDNEKKAERHHPEKKTGDVLVTINTDYGDMKAILYDETPKHKANFLKLAREGFYDGTEFHRIIDGFMVQGGDPNSKDEDPTNDGQGGPGYTIDAEIVKGLEHDYGALAAARLGNQQNPDKKSSGSQFYIVNNPYGSKQLDGEYTVFGHLVEGFAVLDSISNVEKAERDQPKDPIPMTVSVDSISLDQYKEYLEFIASNKKTACEINTANGKAFRAQMAQSPGIQKTESGLMYQAVEKGSGPSPKATDRVKVHYTGKSINGKVFDSSVERGKPATFGLNQVIPGWTEGLQLMAEGAKYIFIIPSELAYGERGSKPNIGECETLVFEVELLKVNP